MIPNNAFRRLVTASHQSRIMFNKQLPQLFEAMSNADSYFGTEFIPYFNGGLFTGTDTIELNAADCDILRKAARNDWSQIEPSIFGTLFERSLDAAKRSMIGAHYTSPEDILLLVEPVVMTPLRREWASTKAAIEEALAAEEGHDERRKLRANRPANKLLTAWAEGLSKVRILDPACGSGNFLYIAMKQLLDLWEEARAFGLKRGLLLPVESMPTPAQLFGIEIDFYAHEIASAVVWIGLLQWKRDHSYNDQPKPVLRKLSNIEHDDAIMRYDEELKSEEFPNGQPYEPSWPDAEYIVGNPPFLGDKLMRRELNTASNPDTVDHLRNLYRDRVPGGADLVTYWFEKARQQIEASRTSRAGLLATQGIRGGLNRVVLERIKRTGNIFWAESDRDWTLNGATVHVSMIAFDDGRQDQKTLDGQAVSEIHPNLTAGVNITSAFTLTENEELCFIGTQKGGPFNINTETARKMLLAPENPNRRNNEGVVKPWANAHDISDRSRGMYIIDFGTDMSAKEAAFFEAPFEYVRRHVLPKRKDLRRSNHRDNWWLHGEARPGFRKKLAGNRRYLATPRHGKHRFFIWLVADVIPDSALAVVPREDDYFYGILNSRIHEKWARAQGTQVREAESGFRYTPKSCFETFPFPYAPGTEPTEADSPIVRAIADAARELVRLRDAWLNPPNTSDEVLKTRTLTKLYNARPEWLANAHRTLDDAVFAAYGWPSNITDQEILARLLALNHERATLRS